MEGSMFKGGLQYKHINDNAGSGHYLLWISAIIKSRSSG